MRGLVLVVALGLFGCGDNNVPATPDPTPDGPPAPTPDSPVAPPLAPCLDRPTDLPLPPTGQLSCDLLPPGFVAP